MRSRPIAVTCLLSALGFSSAVSSSARQPRGVVTMAIADRSNENVSLAAMGYFVVATWSASTNDATDIYAAVSVDGGVSFGMPLRVNSTPGEARAGGEQPPRVALIPNGPLHDPRTVIVWTARGETGTRLLMAGSDDGGRTFRKTEPVPGGAAKGNRGWESITTDGGGRTLAMWLDHRNSAPGTPAMHQHGAAKSEAKAPAAPKPDPVEKANLSQLWFGALDGSIAAKSITGGVCYCCKTSLAASGQNVYGAWRHVFTGNQRDIAFVMSRNGGKTFSQVRRVSEDKWKFDGCPENGPALAVADDGTIYVAWVTPEDGKEGAPLALYYTWSRDGINFEMRKRVRTDGAAGHVQLAPRKEGGVALAWDEATPKGRRVRIAFFGSASRFAPPVDADGLYPALAQSSAGTVVAWVKRGEPKTAIGVTVFR